MMMLILKILPLTVRLPFVCHQAVHTLIVLQKRYLASLGKLTPAEEDSLQQVIIDQRAKVSLGCPSLTYAMLSVIMTFQKDKN